MKLKNLFLFGSTFCVIAMCANAQETNEVQQLKRQLQQLQENFQKVQREQARQIEALTKKLDELQKQQTAAAQLRTNLKPEIAQQPILTPMPTSPAPEIAKVWSPADPIRIGSVQNYINLSFDALIAAGWSSAEDIESLQLGGHDPKQRGFTIQNLETVFEGKVDPYFRGQANIIMQIDPEGETLLEVEEAYLETMSLPWNLQVKAGQFFTEFGRLNPQHPHSWAFVDQSLVNGRFFGADGLRNPGARVSWLMPTPFYSELFFTIQNSRGETAESFRNGHEGEPYLGRLHESGRAKSGGDMLFVPRYAASFDLSDSQTLVAGVSGAFGPNSTGSGRNTEIYGADLFWKWKSLNQHGGFPFVTWQTEGMIRRFEAGAFDWNLDGDGMLNPDGSELDLNGDSVPDVLPRETLIDYGIYSQIAYGFKKGWAAALRGEWVSSNVGKYERLYGRDPERLMRWRVSPNLTWYPSEFSKIRLQYNYDDRRNIGTDHSVWLQFEFLLGAHAAHKF